MDNCAAIFYNFRLDTVGFINVVQFFSIRNKLNFLLLKLSHKTLLRGTYKVVTKRKKKKNLCLSCSRRTAAQVNPCGKRYRGKFLVSEKGFYFGIVSLKVGCSNKNNSNNLLFPIYSPLT